LLPLRNKDIINPMKNTADIYVLGLHDGHCAGAVLLKNGQVVAAINEERLSAIKNHAGVPHRAIKKVLEIARITPRQITCVAIASYIRIVDDAQTRKSRKLYSLIEIIAPFFHDKRFIPLAVKLLHRLKPRNQIFRTLKNLGIEKVPLVFIEHHVAHAASAFFTKPWNQKTLIFTLDGMGDGMSSTVSIGYQNKITRIAQSTFYDSISDNIYSEITEYFGMTRLEHEYKLMGLAPYGNYTKTIDIFRKIIRINPQNPLTFENISHHYQSKLQPLYRKMLIQKRFDHIAAGAQYIFEELVIAWIKAAIKKTGVHKIAVAGGSFLNVKTNMLIRNLPAVEDLFVYPAADDSGIAYGAAIQAYVDYTNNHNIPCDIEPINTVYYGQSFTNDEIKSVLKKSKLISKAHKTNPVEIAHLLTQGKIIAHFAGKDEWGPRALGNRSIIADPRNLEVGQRLNQAIKQRDFWMPFAPAILFEDQQKYILSPHFSPYMTETYQTTPLAQKDIIATIHPADKTARVMSVNEWNIKFYNIIKAFKKKTGVAAVLNTSFNLHGYPLVSTPLQAIWTFQNSKLDALVMEDWIILK
jgi:carbamoyltransferase